MCHIMRCMLLLSPYGLRTIAILIAPVSLLWSTEWLHYKSTTTEWQRSAKNGSWATWSNNINMLAGRTYSVCETQEGSRTEENAQLHHAKLKERTRARQRNRTTVTAVACKAATLLAHSWTTQQIPLTLTPTMPFIRLIDLLCCICGSYETTQFVYSFVTDKQLQSIG